MVMYLTIPRKMDTGIVESSAATNNYGNEQYSIEFTCVGLAT